MHVKCVLRERERERWGGRERERERERAMGTSRERENTVPGSSGTRVSFDDGLDHLQ